MKAIESARADIRAILAMMMDGMSGAELNAEMEARGHSATTTERARAAMSRDGQIERSGVGAATTWRLVGVADPPPIPMVDSTPPPEVAGDVPIHELIEMRITACERKVARKQRHRRTISLPAEPIGLFIMGDPHVDNEGCDWRLIRDHVDMVRRSPGVLAMCVGDVQDNWVGRLSKLYAEASIRATDGWRLSQWLLEQMQWLGVVGGNHDSWAHGPGVDPLAWVSEQANVMAYAPDELILDLRFGELDPLIVKMRHDFRGRSWFHTTHGINKEAMLDPEAHLLVAGHTHDHALLVTEQRMGRITHALRVGSYKRADGYALQNGFPEKRHGSAAVVVIDPAATGHARMTTHFDVGAGLRHVAWLRGSSE